jgi:hypothetical protein
MALDNGRDIAVTWSPNFTARRSAEFQAAVNTSWSQPRLKNAYRIRIDN